MRILFVGKRHYTNRDAFIEKFGMHQFQMDMTRY